MILSEVTVIDFSNRLPGPLATKILANKGANVVKIEDESNPDPFKFEIGNKDQSFQLWYEDLSATKNIQVLNFETEKQKVRDLMTHSDLIFLPNHEGFKKKIGFELNDFKTWKGAVVEYAASKDVKGPHHDLNVLAVTGLLSLYLKGETEKKVDPPFIPVAGISFVQNLSFELLAALYKSKMSKTFVHHEVYFLESMKEIYSFLLRSLKHVHEGKFLHNGLYPCYSIYRLNDGKYLAVAAVETKFWKEFCQTFYLGDISQWDESSFEKVINKISTLKSTDARELLKNKDICVNVI